jgi:ankyrin repeat protein
MNIDFEEFLDSSLEELQEKINNGFVINKKNDKNRYILFLFDEIPIEKYKFLIKNGFDANYKNSLDVSPLHLSHHPEYSKILIENGADVNAQDNNGNTPILYNLTYYKHYVDIDIIDDEGTMNKEQLYDYLKQMQDNMQVLLNFGADPNIKNKFNDSYSSIRNNIFNIPSSNCNSEYIFK